MDLSLSWVIPEHDKVELGRRALRALSVTSEARPRVFGTYEPVRQQLAADDDEPFLAAWRDEAARDVAGGRMLIWKGSTPFRWGLVSFPSKGTAFKELDELEKVVTLRINVRPSGFTEPERRERLVEFVVMVADSLDAVYASAGLDGQAQAEAGIPPLSGGEDTAVINGRWEGLPPVRTWLHWFGEPYMAELANVPGIAKSGRGLLLRRGDQPGLKEELPGPPIPARLCWSIEEGRSWWENERVAAEVIPPIGSRRARRSPKPEAERPPQPTEQAGAAPRIVWKDEDGPGSPGLGHPDRVGPVYLKRLDGSLETLNDGAWIKRGDAERLAARNNYAFDEV